MVGYIQVIRGMILVFLFGIEPNFVPQTITLTDGGMEIQLP